MPHLTYEDDRNPMLLTRAWPRSEVVDDFDAWERKKHFPELVAGPGIVRASYYRALITSLPSAWIGTGIRMACYSAQNLDGLMAWIRSDELAAAVRDGSIWFGKLNELDFQPFTGNVYVVVKAVKKRNAPIEPSLPQVVERFEVGAPDAAEFDAWMRDVHMPAFLGHEAVVRARSLRAIREGIPVPYYCSPGNCALVVEFAPHADLSVALRDDSLGGTLVDSMRWDRRLEYVRREVYQYFTHLNSGRGDAYGAASLQSK
jgi:hypothetical protein